MFKTTTSNNNDTQFKVGMILENGKGKELICISPAKLLFGRGWTLNKKRYSTSTRISSLNELNRNSIHTWRVKR